MSAKRSPATPLRFGVLAPPGPLPDWQAACLRSLLALPGVELALWIDDDRDGRHRPGATHSLHTALFAGYRTLVGPPRSLRPTTVDDLCAGSPRVSHSVQSKDGPRPSVAEVACIRQHALDFILDFGTGPRDGSILDTARFGLWRFVTGAPTGWEGDMAAFWAIYERERVTAGHLVRLKDDSDRCIILRSGYLRTIDHSYSATVDSLLSEVASWPAYVCRALQDCHEPALTGPCVPVPQWSHRLPTNREMLHFLGILASNVISRAINLLFRFSAWNIGVVQAPIHTLLDTGGAPAIDWLPEAGNSVFRADPFALDVPEGRYLFFEEYHYHSTTAASTNSKGVISCAQLDRGQITDLERGIIELPSHMSYPYLVHHAGNVYCVPETSEAREVALYRATRFPGGWGKVGTLLEDVAALDSTIFEWNGRWWLMCTDADRRSLEALSIYHSHDLFGPWMPHARNPVKLDARSARPAGTPFVHGGALYRPAQDCSGRYGGSVTVNRVIELTPESFLEETVATVRPDPRGPYRHGIHTVSAAGNITLVDGRRLIFAPTAFAHRLRSAGRLALQRLQLAGNRAPAEESKAREVPA